ncbi:MAG TPA: rod shape-determining protein MreC [Gemmatimonadaceae bacterium]|nr:rod shape-determining protein MreC [Gemmatimonadaceae bacterium]
MASAARSVGRWDSGLLIACVVLSLVAQGLPDGLRASVTASLRRTILAPLVKMQYNAELSRRSWLTREARTVAEDSVALRSMRLAGVENENVRLRRMLGLGHALRWGFVPAEALTRREPGEEYSVVLSAGSQDGVRPFSPVVAPEGLVGMVKEVDPSMSVAILWTNPDFRVSAMTADGAAFGIVAAHLAGGADRYLLEMRGVPLRSTLAPGTLVLSSGLGGVYPRGIPIGTVLGQIKTSEVWAHTYLLRPTVLPADVREVMILLPRRAMAGVAGVWTQGASADSAAKSIVAAEDSIVRRAARLGAGTGSAPAADSAHAPGAGGAGRRDRP